ncbi:MAG TPA: helix-turn-helix domain-containing protein [Ktedonobacteraceae bacterium]|nr:helix-turn-helix domain-containing protein [Ktedonobacteraceae bacterium]
MNKDKDWLSVEDIATELDMSVTTVRGWIRDKKLKAAKLGRDYRVRRADYETFIEKSFNIPATEQKTESAGE